MRNIFRNGRRSTQGFSLIEILVAVVVLATGLLALTALQGRLAQASSEAKTRSRVAAMLASRMDELRAGQYDNTALAYDASTGSTTTTFTCTSGAPTWLCTAQTESAISGLSVSQVVQRYTSAIGASAFAVAGTAAANLAIPEFKRVTLTATWTDATGSGRRLSVSSDVSPLSLSSNTIPNSGNASAGASKAIVRQDSPATAGVIPIALGDGNSTAASNPTPELKGRNNNQIVTATRFNVLTYVPNGSSATIQKRFENEIVKCQCRYGAAGSNFGNLEEIYRTPQWPAVWTGSRYDVYDAGGAAAPGASYTSGQASGVTQSDLCQECCRDHHDTSATGVAKFDPERINAGGGTSKYDDSLTVVSNTNSGNYVNACRVIRVDGYWRVASDMYSRQMGLLETETVSGAKAKTGLPTSAAKTAYETYVKDYLDGYDGTTGTAPSGAQAMFDEAGRGLNAPTQVDIATASNSDYRYLHSRGLYVDYLEAGARTALTKAINDCATGKPLADCILPVLPFTTVNLTEIATWASSNATVLTVNSGNLLATNPSQPSGSRAVGNANGSANNTATMRVSNSGVAVQTGFTFGGVDPSDNSTVQTDVQAFQVGSGSSGGGSGQAFAVRITGGGLNPYVFYTISSDTGECFKPSGTDHACNTNSTLGVGGSIQLSNYNLETTTDLAAATVLAAVGTQCTYNGSPVTVETPNGNGSNTKISTPTFRNYQASSIAIAGVPAISITYANDNKTAESLVATFLAIPSGGRVDVTFSEQSGSPTYATLLSCTAVKSGNKYYYASGTWSKPWTTP